MQYILYKTLYRRGFYAYPIKPFASKAFTNNVILFILFPSGELSLKPLSVLNFIRNSDSLKILKEIKSRYLCRYKKLHYEQSRINFKNCR
jgi:hypothetical protein